MKVRTVARVVAMGCALLMAGWTGGAFAQITTAMSCQAEYFPIVCRGPLDYKLGVGYNDRVAFEELAFHFSRAASAAGPVGATLPSGSCAWVDRAVGSSEPNVILIRPTEARSLFEREHLPGQMQLMASIERCNAEGSRCRFQVCVRNSGGRLLTAQPTSATIIFDR